MLDGVRMRACLAVAAAAWHEAEAEFTKAAGIASVHVSVGAEGNGCTGECLLLL